MRCISMENTSLWCNIEHIAVVFCNFDASVYQCAHFYEKGSVPPQIFSTDR